LVLIFESVPFDTIVDDPLCSKFNLLINTTHQVLICTDERCRFILNPGAAREHISQRHKHREKLPTDFDKKLLEKHPQLTYTPMCPTEPVEVVFGLQPPKAMIQCPVCMHFFFTQNDFEWPTFPKLRGLSNQH
jgi:hypothetical protein